jgi:hypothetical protein
VSNKVPGQAEKWDDVIRQLTSVWTPESAARVLAAIAQLDLQGSSSEGDVLTRVGDKFVPQPASGGNCVLMANGRLTQSDLFALHDTPKVAVPAPGVGALLLPLYWGLQLRFGTAAYVEGAYNDRVKLRYGNLTSGIGVWDSDRDAITASEDTMYYLLFSAQSFTTSDAQNQPLVLWSEANWTGGDGTLDWFVGYQVVPAP